MAPITPRSRTVNSTGKRRRDWRPQEPDVEQRQQHGGSRVSTARPELSVQDPLTTQAVDAGRGAWERRGEKKQNRDRDSIANLTPSSKRLT